MNFHPEYRCMSRATLPGIQLHTQGTLCTLNSCLRDESGLPLTSSSSRGFHCHLGRFCGLSCLFGEWNWTSSLGNDSIVGDQQPER